MQSRERIRVKNRRRQHQTAGVATWIQGQDTRLAAPDHFLSFDECKALAGGGNGRFINRGAGFIRFDTCLPRPQPETQNGKPSRLSRNIDGGVIHRYAEAVAANNDPLVIAAVESWA